MKYPQLVSMPSAVQDWLDEQLEARGIDAVVYTRYILSLLQRDTLDLPDDLLTLSPNKGKEVGRRGRKRGRREEYWDVWDCERLKRSAAVECLMSASDQKCGIEKLVDELCAKLKEIQSEGENTVNTSLSQSTVPVNQLSTQSPQDQIQKYYAAFPPLNGKSSETNDSIITLIPDHSSAWTGKKVLADSFGKNKPLIGNASVSTSTVKQGLAEDDKENQAKVKSIDSCWKEVGGGNMKCRGQLHDKFSCNKKEEGYGFAWNMADERNEVYSDFCSGSANPDGSDLLRVFKYNEQNRRDDGWDSGMCRRLYERQPGEDENDATLHDMENALQDENQSNDIDDDLSKKGVDDSNLAQLIAKFDHSIEAIWNPEDTPTSPDNTVDSTQELPLDFPQLLVSPNEHLLTVELYNLNNKHNSDGNSFIQCGTNITNSIWSDQPSKDNSVDQDDYGMEYTLEQPSSEKLEKTCEKELANYDTKEVHMAGKFQVVLVGDGKVTGNNCSSDKSVSVQPGERERCNFQFKIAESVNIAGVSEEKSKISWNRLESFPSFFTSLSWGGLNYSVGKIPHSFGHHKWSEMEHSSMLGNYAQNNIFTSSYLYSSKSNQFNSLADIGGSCSFNTLNHNREDSSFTEVIPKNTGNENLEHCLLHVNDITQSSGEEVDVISEEYCKKDSDLDKEKEEEDLLTSNRTHFRPIRQESLDSHNVAGYADGTTFVIPNNLEEVSFKRSESGALYLENDVGPETPKKYMEYKEKEPYGGRHKCDDHSPSSNNLFPFGNNFIPKFRVRQSEKCCQTEEADDMTTSDEEIDAKRSRQDNKMEGETDAHAFYFPGDEHFAEKILNCLEEDASKHAEPCLACHQDIKTSSSCVTTPFLKSDIPHVHHCGKLPGNEDNSVVLHGRSETDIQSWSATLKSCCRCNNNNLLAWKNGWLKGSSIGLPNKSGIWEISDSEKANDLSQSWYDIWRGSPGPGAVLCSKCCGNSPHAGMENGKSLQYCRLREELSEDGEQLLSDLSYLQHLYLGSDWLEDSGEQPMVDWGSEHELLPAKKLQCLSPAGDPSHELQLYDDDESICTHSLPVHLVEHHSLKEEFGEVGTKSVIDFVSTCSPSTHPNKILFTNELETECKINERPFIVKASQKDRKRRHSASQRACSFFLEGSCELSHSRFSHDLASVPCRSWADSSCLKGVACPYLHGCARALRPVTL